MKRGQNFCLDEFLDDTKMGYVGSKTRSLVHILENFVYALETRFSVMELGQSFCPNEILYIFENG